MINIKIKIQNSFLGLFYNQGRSMISLSLVILILEAIAVTFVRLWYLMLVSILLAIIFGILAAKVRIAEMIIIPITDVLEAVPVISFFPIVLVLFIVDIGGPIGIELAVDFLIITALLWNLILGVYQAVIHIPNEFNDVAKVFKLGFWNRIRYLYIPVSFPKIVANIMPSFASGLFYITLSEVIYLGPKSYHVFGIGMVAVELASKNNVQAELLMLLILVVAIFLNFYLIINPLIKYSEKYTIELEKSQEEMERTRSRNYFINSISQRTNQIVISGAQLFSSINKITNYIPRQWIKKRIKLSNRAVNVVVGLVLILILAISIYVIAQSGFSQAFVLYVINRNFLYEATVGTLYDLLRIFIVYVVSLLTMVPLAILAATHGRKGNTLNGLMQVIYAIPAPVFFPLIVVYLTPYVMHFLNFDYAFNIDVFIITYLSAAAYIFFNVYGAVRSIPSELSVVAKTFKFKWFGRLKYLIFPSIVPALITGSMSAVGSYWAGLMVGEYIIVQNKTYLVSFGLMKMIDMAIANGNLLYADAIDIYMVIIIVIISYLLWIRLYEYSKRRFSL